MSATPWQIRGPAPRLGQHNAEVYEEEMGFSQAETARLREQGVI
jgi:crotonobetainyl-CoA:carnitine CoA-transferase CaiB-like acyl-CoA transferase